MNPWGTGQVVICAGKEMSRNTRPVMAGLNTFCPIPPKDILATPMATKAPITIIHHEMPEGRFIPRSMPVTTAERSPMVELFLSRYLVMAHSRSTHEATLTAIVRIALHP